jgi:hypothetical protein
MQITDSPTLLQLALRRHAHQGKENFMRCLLACLLLALTGCAFTRITPAGSDTYMASAHTVHGALKAANKSCAKVSKTVKIQKIDSDGALIVFSSVDG